MDVVKPVAHGSLVVHLGETVLLEGPPRMVFVWPDMDPREIANIMDEKTIAISIPTPLDAVRHATIGSDTHEIRYIVTPFKGNAATVTYTIIGK